MALAEDSPLKAISPNARPYPVPANEGERLEALYALKVLDSEPEVTFDKVAIMVARLFSAPIALVSLVDAERQWFKAKCGLGAIETSRDFSFCTYAMLEPEPMVVCDATRDRRFKDNPLVTGEMSFRFYVGAPMLSRAGLPLGTLCVIDTKVRERPPQQLLDGLMDLAYLLGEQLEYRAAVAAKNAIEKRHLEELEHARQAADRANFAKSDFLARMSHEIRTPMNLILGMNSLLLESPLNDKQRQHVEISQRSVRRLLRLINGILDLSKVEAGELIFQQVPFDLKEVVSECAATVAAAIERNGLKFETSIDDNAARYWVGDPERLQQVLLNVIGNSIKFTREGGIQLKVFAEAASTGQNGLRFEISDTGCGIASDQADTVFEAFHQVQGSAARSYEGTGLGLSIAKTLVEHMSGRIWVQEKGTPGALFVFTIFLKPATEQAVRSPAASAIPLSSQLGSQATTRILLVEDNSDNVVLMKAYLEKLPVSLHVAENGAEALALRQANDYDLLLMDMQMPVMDGCTATREIRKWEAANRTNRIPIVALTAHAFHGALADSLKAGCDAHLTKPVERSDLVGVIARFAHADGNDHSEADDEVAAAILARRPVFLANRKADLLKLHDALATGNFALIQSIGHNCKGTGTGYGFPEISQLGLALEKAAKAQDGEKVKESIGLMEKCVLECVGKRQ